MMKLTNGIGIRKTAMERTTNKKARIQRNESLLLFIYVLLRRDVRHDHDSLLHHNRIRRPHRL